MSETDTPDDNQISDDDWAAAMQEQAAEGLTDPANPAWPTNPPTRPSRQPAVPGFGQAGAKAALNDYDMILDIPVQLTVELGRTKIAIRNLLQLAHGSVVELDGLAGEPMDVLVNGTLIAQGEVVVVVTSSASA
jgi:flagellar motor switch protein FliN/FliY